MSRTVDVVRRLFTAVANRDLGTLLDCYHDEVEIHESPALPYGGVYRGLDGAGRHARAFAEAWGPYQSTRGTPLDPMFSEGEDGAVTVMFRHRAVDVDRHRRLDTAEVGIYHVLDGKVARAQMFHFDPSELTRFLASRSA
ncbi:MAG: nuclear transport factor 2 family protein [Kutzneria sp.]|nr:nuclear transport factor 2 family protein [Kutzneria sp.]